MVDILPVQVIQDHAKSSRILTKEDRRNNNPGVLPVDLNRVGLNRVDLNRVGLNRVGLNRVGLNKDHRCRASGETNRVGGREEEWVVVLVLDPKGNSGDVHLVKWDSLGQKVRQEGMHHHHNNGNNNLHRKEDGRSKAEVLIHLHTQGGLTVTKLHMHIEESEKQKL